MDEWEANTPYNTKVRIDGTSFEPICVTCKFPRAEITVFVNGMGLIRWYMPNPNNLGAITWEQWSYLHNTINKIVTAHPGLINQYR